MASRVIDQGYNDKMHHRLTREYYGHSDFFNFGYWRPDTASQKEACENLLEELLATIPAKDGLILDVACGLGATTRHLLRYYDPSAVIGINISRPQLRTSTQNAPHCSFFQMNATHLAFDDNSVDNIICVEAAFHFETRTAFLREALRVLKPGGRLVLTDILIPAWASRLNRRLPHSNWIGQPETYRQHFEDTGFKSVTVNDIRDASWGEFYNRAYAWRRDKYRTGEIPTVPYLGMVLRNFIGNLGLKHYLLVSAQK